MLRCGRLAATLGPAHPATRKTQYHWAVLCEQVGDYEAAGHLYRLVDQAQETAGLEPGAGCPTRVCAAQGRWL